MAAVCVYIKQVNVYVCVYIPNFFFLPAFMFQVEPVGGASLKLCWHHFLPGPLLLFLTLPASGLMLRYIHPVCTAFPHPWTVPWPNLDYPILILGLSVVLLKIHAGLSSPSPFLCLFGNSGSPFKISSDFYHLQGLSLVPLKFAPCLCFCFRFCQVSGCLFYMSVFPIWMSSLSAGLFTK